ncbi:uncharacterized protein LOC124942904 [Impatiens glandulifera]|uniref:uncharacterized protein LOC124942904 n=1 Tax=Impatiens glandulifera TaxID=253017 RepID=UPI001FB0CFB4|nr:uncharacterized protein LOC124942904 [Impatiens glandulifera]
MMTVKKLFGRQWRIFIIIIIIIALSNFSLVSSKHHGNPANDIIEIINTNRTNDKLSRLNNNPGLGCMALQYSKQCKGNCTRNNTITCQPNEDDFTEIFAANCGVELPTFGTITGHIIGCNHKYLKSPSEVFYRVLFRDKKSVSILRNRNHTEVGIGLVGGNDGYYYWCVIFGGDQGNTSSFKLEDMGKGIKQKKGCFSGSGDSFCKQINGGGRLLNNVLLLVLLLLLVLYV